jgi:hypothetical protein
MNGSWLGTDAPLGLFLALLTWYAVPLIVTILVIVLMLLRARRVRSRRTVRTMATGLPTPIRREWSHR